MAGNLVKWWKHKILGGYKQFSVQECTTDSEELMYHQVRASSSCSAPPDLLLVSDRENNIPLRSPVVNIIGATTAPATTTTSPVSSSINACHLTSATNNNQKHNQKLLLHQQQQQQHHHVSAQQLSLVYNGTKDIGGNGKQQKQSSGNGSSHAKHGQQQQQQQECQQQTTTLHDIEGQLETQTNNHSSTRHAHQTQYQQQQHQQQQQQRSEEHIRLEEFTCDVSVEGGKSTQPLQFSFTFYDLDGHHGKITKDDIVGIVYTIYESIGKSVVVPHSGSKTINVRLTVSPEGKSKTAKNKKTSSNTVVLDAAQKSAPIAPASQQAVARRLHRYRPRKLIKSDEEDDESNSDKERENTHMNSSNLSQILAHKSATKSHNKSNKLKIEQQCCQSLPPNTIDIPNSPLETIYDNLKTVTATTPDAGCRECLAAVDESRNAAISPTIAQYPANKSTATNEAYMKHVASTRMKMLRKSRKQKHQDCMETRQRSLSVGNETCWKNRHLQKQQTQQQLLWHAEQQLNHSAGGGGGADVVDGVQLRNPIKAAKLAATAASQNRNSAECWKTGLNRNDLISIIRESMEKNRLCFQLNGKPQANVSPIRHSQPPTTIQQTQQQHHQQHLTQYPHNNSSSNSNKHSQQQLQQTSTATFSQQHRQRSNTVSKIPTLIANHNNVHSLSPHQTHYHSFQQRSSSCANTISTNNNNNDTNLHEQHNSTNSSNNIYHHLQPHIPIYHQQLAINPAVIAAHNALLNAGNSSASGHHGKMNLCGYDSFLHATICGGGLSHSPPPHSSLSNQLATSSPAQQSSVNQQIATVQPIMSTQQAVKSLSLAVTPNQIKTSKILRSGSFAQTQHQFNTQASHNTQTHNSPQYHGYQRLPSSSKHNLSAMHLISPSLEKQPLEQLDKWRRDQIKNYDQLLYAKLSEKLQQTNLVAANSNVREGHLRRKHRILKQRRTNAVISEANNVILNSKICLRDDSDYAAMVNIEGDAVECENLLGQTSDEENHSQHELPPAQAAEQTAKENIAATRHVAEGTLVELDDVDVDDLAQAKTTHSKHTLNVDTLLNVDSGATHELHLDMEEGLVDEEVGGAATASGRISANSDVSNNPGEILANASAANTNNTSSSSLIHRYVHEHIHHHYHHFEEKEE